MLTRGLPFDVCGSSGASGVEWAATERESLTRLRSLRQSDCWVRAWLQFARAPGIGDGSVTDLRFGGLGNFTTMPLRPFAEASVCPPHLTPWAMPRADLVGGV